MPYTTLLLLRLLPPLLHQVYTLHRRLNGCFQLAARVGARIHARDILLDAYDNHEWYDPEAQAEAPVAEVAQ